MKSAEKWRRKMMKNGDEKCGGKGMKSDEIQG